MRARDQCRTCPPSQHWSVRHPVHIVAVPVNSGASRVETVIGCNLARTRKLRKYLQYLQTPAHSTQMSYSKVGLTSSTAMVAELGGLVPIYKMHFPIGTDREETSAAKVPVSWLFANPILPLLRLAQAMTSPVPILTTMTKESIGLREGDIIAVPLVCLFLLSFALWLTWMEVLLLTWAIGTTEVAQAGTPPVGIFISPCSGGLSRSDRSGSADKYVSGSSRTIQPIQ